MRIVLQQINNQKERVGMCILLDVLFIFLILALLY